MPSTLSGALTRGHRTHENTAPARRSGRRPRPPAALTHRAPAADATGTASPCLDGPLRRHVNTDATMGAAPPLAALADGSVAASNPRTGFASSASVTCLIVRKATPPRPAETALRAKGLRTSNNALCEGDAYYANPLESTRFPSSPPTQPPAANALGRLLWLQTKRA